jgi:hypothetical protein
MKLFWEEDLIWVIQENRLEIKFWLIKLNFLIKMFLRIGAFSVWILSIDYSKEINKVDLDIME